MKLTEKTLKINSNNHLNIAVDVSSKKLDIYFELKTYESQLHIYRSQISNTSKSITQALGEYFKIATSHAFENIRVVCEPTGTYSVNLMTIAKKLNHSTAYVNPEAVNKSKVIETNSTGKTDLIDAVIIFNLAQRNKILTHRIFCKNYESLRQLNVHYEDLDQNYVRSRAYIHNWLNLLFPDLSLKNNTLYSKTGKALYENYGFNPWKITNSSTEIFIQTMKNSGKGLQQKMLHKIWLEAKHTCEFKNKDTASIYESCLRDHYQDLIRYQKRKDAIRAKMEGTLKKIRKSDKQIPPAIKGYISNFHIARLLGETGPLCDFHSYRSLQSYLGLNLREKQSGNYKGKTRISKKGRSLARKILSQIVLPLVTKKAVYGEAYHRKKAETGKSGTLLMTNYMRHFLKSFYGIYKSGGSFDKERLFTDKGKYNKLENKP